jgi:hypothetical protein
MGYMSERLVAAIEEIEAQIKSKEAEITPLKLTVNQLCQIIGEPARYQVDGMGASGQPKRNVLNWKVDQFFSRPLASCVTEYLEARETAGLDRAASVDDIYEALVKGGYKFEGVTGSEDNQKRALKISLTKNTTQFAKISENTFGLRKWYPNARTPRKNGNGGGKDDAEDTKALADATTAAPLAAPDKPQLSAPAGSAPEVAA